MMNVGGGAVRRPAGQPQPVPAPTGPPPQGWGAGAAQNAGFYNPQSSGQHAATGSAFARAQLMRAQAQGLLPSNFDVARTGQNVVGQWHQLSGGIGQLRKDNKPGGATPDAARAAIMQRIQSLGGSKFAGPDAAHPMGRGWQPEQAQVAATQQPQGQAQNPYGPAPVDPTMMGYLQFIFGGGGQGQMPYYGGFDPSAMQGMQSTGFDPNFGNNAPAFDPYAKYRG